MKLIATPDTIHLADQMNIEKIPIEYKHFLDGELHVALKKHDLFPQNIVWVLAATPGGAKSWFELFFVLDALQRLNVRIRLLLTYLGYARQDRAHKGEALSAAVVLSFLRSYRLLEKTYIIHVHEPLIRRFFDFEDIILIDFFAPYIQNADILVAPDQGSALLIKYLAGKFKKEALFLKKERAADTVTIESINTEVSQKSVLIIDDMIATGSTICVAAQMLHDNGAQSIYAAATHGLFTGDAYQNIKQSPIEHIYVTNSLSQPETYPTDKITAINCASFLEQIIIAESG